MNTSIIFSVGTFSVTPFSLALALSVAVGLGVLLIFHKYWCQSLDNLSLFALIALSLAWMGARLYYCLARLPLYIEIGLENIFKVQEGGFAIWGAILGTVLAALIVAKRAGQRPVAFLNSIAPAGALTLALGRLAEGLSGEGYGPLVENSSFSFFPLAIKNEWGEWYFAIFILEALTAFVLFLLLLRTNRKGGRSAHLFFIVYCTTQILYESLRRDSMLRWLFVRVSQLNAALVLGGMMFYFLAVWKKHASGKRKPARYLALRWVGFLLCAAGIILCEFAVDKSASLSVGMSYLIMSLFCLGVGICAYQLTDPERLLSA